MIHYNFHVRICPAISFNKEHIFLQSKALNQTGKPILFNSCEWGEDDPWTWMRPYANAWRTGPDHHDKWASTGLIIELNDALGDYAGQCTYSGQIPKKA